MIKTIFTTSYTGHRQQRSWRIDVVDANYTGSPEAPALDLGSVDAQGAVVKWGNDRDLYEPIIASQAEVKLYLTGAAKTWATVTLPLSQESRYFLEIYENNALFWRGVIIQDQVKFYELPDPLPFTLSAMCGLGRLQKLDYDYQFAFPSGYQTATLFNEILRVLKIATVEPNLYKNTDAFIRTNFQWYEVNMDSTVGGIDPLLLISYNVQNVAEFPQDNSDVKEYISLTDYLRQILMNFGLSITYANGAWQLFQVNELNTTAQTTRYYTYAVNYVARLNPNENTGSQLSAYVATTVQKNVSKTISKGNLTPLSGILNSYKAPFYKITTEPLFDFSLLVYRNPAIDLVPAAVLENYILSGTWGFRINIQTDVLVDGTSLSAPIVVRVEGQMRLSITDGSQTRYLTSTGAWVTANTTFSIGFDTDQVLNGQIRNFALGVAFDSNALPFAGVLSLQATSITAAQLPGGANQNALITSRLSDVTIEHFDTTGAGSIRREFYTVENQTAGIQSSVDALLRLPLFDRASRYILNAVFIWDEAQLKRVHSQLWRKNDVGDYSNLHILVLRQALIRRQIPARLKEGTYIGFIAPNEKAKDEGANWAFVNGEFSTGYDQMNRVQLQNLGADVFTVDPLPSDRTELNPNSGVATGGNRVSGFQNTLAEIGVPLEPIAAGTLSSISTPVEIPFTMAADTLVLILDLTGGVIVRARVKNATEAGVTSFEVNSITVSQPIIAPYLFFPQFTLLN
jgi:hypothetical protein